MRPRPQSPRSDRPAAVLDRAQAIVPVLRAGLLAQEFCRRHARATVEAVFARSVYLRADDDFICVGQPDLGNGPLTLIASLGGLPDRLQPGQMTEVCERHIVIGSAVRFSLAKSETWRAPQWPACPPPATLIQTYADLARRAASDAPDEGLARCAFNVGESPLGRIARPRISSFERALAGNFPDDAVRGLLGLGPGLTPSGDDFLVGGLALLDCVGERDAHAALARAIIAALPGATSPLSANFLRAAAAGHVGETLHRAVSSVMTNDVDAAIDAVDGVGHSSGWDMLAGVAAALRLVVAARLQASLETI